MGCFVGPPACDASCDPPPDLPGNQDPASLEPCPPLPAGVEPIEGLVSARVWDRFDGFVLTLSTRALACGEPAVQHGYCGRDELGITLGFRGEHAVPGAHFIEPLYVEFETPELIAGDGGRDIDGATVEIFEITDACVTGRLVGVAAAEGPFDGGFQAPRCTP